MSYIYENSYQQISMPFYTDDTLTTLVDANDYVEAEYRIYQSGTCTEVYSASLGGGVTVSGTTFVLTIPEGGISFNGTYDHVLRVAKLAGQLGPPLFSEALTVIPVCEVV